MRQLLATYALAPNELGVESCSAFICGLANDDRGKAAIEFGRSTCQSAYECLYSQPDLSYTLNGEPWPIDDIRPLVEIFVRGNVLCDATTLGFVETLLCLRAQRIAGVSKTFMLYVEPRQYKLERTSGVLHRRDFSLTDRASLFSGIPGNLILLDGQTRTKAAVLVGYEGDRLEQFLEQNAMSSDDCSVVYGVPAFNAGWEMNAFSNTIGILDERRINSVLFASAVNPMSAYDTIRDIHAGVGDNESFLVVPIGTKPHGIGAALYACEHPDVGLVYDHPKKLSGRSDGVGVWNCYTIGN